MKNLKPSQLPVNTVIEVDYDLAHGGRYIKEDHGIYGIAWYPLSCIDCTGSYDFKDAAADAFFTEFKVISVPMEVVNYFVEAVAAYEELEWAKEADREEILKDAFDSILNPSTPQEDLVWKHLNSFENLYMEINEKGQVRTDFNGQVYSPEFDDDVNQWLVTVKTEEGNEIILDARYFVKQQFDKDYL